jgi:ribosome recycling factor
VSFDTLSHLYAKDPKAYANKHRKAVKRALSNAEDYIRELRAEAEKLDDVSRMSNDEVFAMRDRYDKKCG